MTADRLTWAQARRIALRSQGIGARRAGTALSRRASREALRRTVARTHLLQIDSVSVFARAHHLPVFTRSGPWDPGVLARASAPGHARLLTESFAHEATLVEPEVHELLRFRRARVARADWGAVRRAAVADPALLRTVEELVAREGPLTAPAISRRLGDSRRPETGWGWRRTDTQWVVEYLFRSGRLDGVGRTAQFERLYGPLDAAHAPGPVGEDVGEGAPGDDGEERRALLELTRLASTALGIATPASIADYFRLPRGDVAPAIDALQATGELRPVTVARPDGDVPMLLREDAPAPTPLRGGALMSPFDPVAFHRPRLESLFDVVYRIGIYTPREKRTHGYYALPFLLGDRFEARVDLRADRARGVLEVCEVHGEPLPALSRTVRRPAPEAVAAELAAELERAARWQGLDAVEVLDRGDLAVPLARAVRDLAGGAPPAA